MARDGAGVLPRAGVPAARAAGRHLWAWQVAVIPVVILAWHLTYLAVGDYILASPYEAAATLAGNLQKPSFIANGLATLQGLAMAFLLSTAVGLVGGVFLGLRGDWGGALAPVLYALYSMPKVALYPIFLLVFGLELSSRVAFAWFHGVFPMLLLTMEGVREVDRVYLKVARAYRVPFWKQLRHVILPAAVPSIVVALRISFSLTFIGLIVGEMFSSHGGLGFELMRSMSLLQVNHLLALLILILFLALAPAFLFMAWERRVRRPLAGGM